MANTDYVPNTYFEVIFGAPGLGTLRRSVG